MREKEASKMSVRQLAVRRASSTGRRFSDALDLGGDLGAFVRHIEVPLSLFADPHPSLGLLLVPGAADSQRVVVQGHVAHRQGKASEMGMSRDDADEVGVPEPEHGFERREEFALALCQEELFAFFADEVPDAEAGLLVAELTPEGAAVVHGERAMVPGRVCANM